MTRRRILPRLLAVGLVVLALAGCVRFQADLTLDDGDILDGQLVVAVLDTEKTAESRATALGYVAEIESRLLGSLRDTPGVTTSEYDRDDYVGSFIEFDNLPLDVLSGQEPESLRFVRDGDSYVFTGILDFTAQSVPSDQPADDGGDIRVSVTFPGPVTEQSNGEVSGTTVTWTAALDQRVEMSARGHAALPGPPVLLIVGIVVGALVLIAAIVVIVLLVRARGARASLARVRATTEPPAGTPSTPEV